MDVRVHPFYPDPELGRDWREQPYCASCPLPKRHPVHEMPETPEGDVSDRIVGERQRGDAA